MPNRKKNYNCIFLKKIINFKLYKELNFFIIIFKIYKFIYLLK